MNDVVLKIENLKFGYTKNVLLFDGFSLELKKGEIVSIVGESGKGKSTLFDLIAGLKKPMEGSIKSSSLSFIFQDPYSSFHSSYSIKNQIEDVAKGELDMDMLEQTLLLEPSLLEKKPYELSGGQLQRCSIFRALSMKPDLILADEPTSALDNIVQLEVMKALVAASKEQGLLIITHDLALAQWCSDRIVRL
ncbi:MAG: ATP-binding cassette domain-containing protein [Campylobacterales bacterium]